MTLLRKKILIAALTSIVAIGSAQAFLRGIGLPPPGFQPFPDWPIAGLAVPHPTRGYTYSPNFRGEVIRDGRSIPIQTNAEGFRDRPFHRQGNQSLVLAVGDAFAAGWGLEVEKAWPAQLEGVPNRAERVNTSISSPRGLARSIRVSSNTSTRFCENSGSRHTENGPTRSPSSLASTGRRIISM